ncbi:MAG: DUF2889 domain-containing protein [Deltaproteobacteria bacterium]|jgi:hypothetical protein
MPDLTSFTRNRCTSVEQIDDQTLRSSCRLQDTLTDAMVEIQVKLPDLEIIEAAGEVLRTHRRECLNVGGELEKIVGVRIGSGMLKIIEGLLAETTHCAELAFMVEECCHAVILSFTKGTLKDVPESPRERKEFFSNMIKENTRLYNRCAAFAPGSSIVGDIPPE